MVGQKNQIDCQNILDKDGRSGSLEQYESILDKSPHLLPFDNEDFS